MRFEEKKSGHTKENVDGSKLFRVSVSDTYTSTALVRVGFVPGGGKSGQDRPHRRGRGSRRIGRPRQDPAGSLYNT